MDKFLIQGGQPLEGQIAASGAKNSALPVLAACLLTAERVTLERIPQVRDIATMERLLKHAGAQVTRRNGQVTVEAATIEHPEAPYEVVKTMRASSLVLGPLVARCGRARVSLPGGCAIGARPINLHVAGLERLGAVVRQEHGYIEAQAPHGLTGAGVTFDRISVTGTEDLLMAAVLARGETVIHNAACGPEVADVAALLIKMGARIEGAGTSTIRVQGVDRLHGTPSGTAHSIIPDRIEAGTFLIAGAMTGGDLTVTDCEPEHLRALLAKLSEAGRGSDRARAPVHTDSLERKIEERRHDHPGASWLPHRSSSAVYGTDDAGGRDRHDHGNDFRESLHACAGTGADGCEYPSGWTTGDSRRADTAFRGASDRERPARERVAGAGGAGGRGRNADRPRLPHRSRVREDRGEAGGSRGQNREGEIANAPASRAFRR